MVGWFYQAYLFTLFSRVAIPGLVSDKLGTILQLLLKEYYVSYIVVKHREGEIV